MALRILLLTGWVLVGLGGVVYHLSAGPEHKALDAAADHVKAAEKASAGEDYATAVGEYEEALKQLPEGRTAEGRRLRLAKAKAQMLARQLPEAHADLKGLVDEVTADPAAEAGLVAEARATLANSQYYVTWLMRLEGMPPEEWEPEIEASRQGYRLLAEQAAKRGDAAGEKKHREDLEAAVRLAQMDLSELQGLPLPSQ